MLIYPTRQQSLILLAVLSSYFSISDCSIFFQSTGSSLFYLVFMTHDLNHSYQYSQLHCFPRPPIQSYNPGPNWLVDFFVHTLSLLTPSGKNYSAKEIEATPGFSPLNWVSGGPDQFFHNSFSKFHQLPPSLTISADNFVSYSLGRTEAIKHWCPETLPTILFDTIFIPEWDNCLPSEELIFLSTPKSPSADLEPFYDLTSSINFPFSCIFKCFYSVGNKQFLTGHSPSYSQSSA